MAQDTFSVARIVLAAGRGSRMGENKALLRLGKLSALERIAQCQFAPLKMTTHVVCGFSRSTVEQHAADLGLTCVFNPNWEQGQTGSLIAGIKHAPPSDYYLLHPVDLPLISQDDYDALAAAMSLKPNHVIYVTSVAKRQGHPLVFSREFAGTILQLGPDDTLRDLVRLEKDTTYVEVGNPWVRKDLDTPHDLAEARSYLASRGESTSP